MRFNRRKNTIGEDGNKTKTKYNNRKIDAYGLKFDSQLEKYMYDLLADANVSFTFKKQYVLMAGFRNILGKKIRDINIIVDFYVHIDNVEYIIDTKGFFLELSKIKYKLLENILMKENKNYVLAFPKNRTMVTDIVNEIKRKRDGKTLLLNINV